MKIRELNTPINNDTNAVLNNIIPFREAIKHIESKDYDRMKDIRSACIKGRKILELEIEYIYNEILSYLIDGGDPLADPEELFFTECDFMIEHYENAIELINRNIYRCEQLMIEYLENENKYLAIN